jgi:pimeloyl-ACP methyl ester carboxylesterase
MTDLHQKVIDLEGGSIGYLEAGTGETVVYLHGAGGRPPAGATFVSELAKDFRVLLPSRPGFDDSSEVGKRTPDGAAAAVAAFIEATSNGPVHVVAQSAGGAIGLWFAVLRPDLVSSLVVSAPSAFAHRPPPREGGSVRSPQDLEKVLYGDRPTWSALPTTEEQERIRRNASFNMQNFGGSNEELLVRLGEIKAPVLVLWGTEDRLVPSDGSGMYQKHIPHAVRMFIYGASHELPIAATAAWVSLVRDFIRRGEFFVVNSGGE